MTPIPCVRIEAPAKINLGLEVLGRRPDGFHEIRTVMTMLELSDTVRIHVGGAGAGVDLPNLPAGDNLISRALSAFQEAAPATPALGWSLVKRIPAAAGLGGASSDAAAALLAANALCGQPLGADEVGQIAAALGSDVPFFLGSPVALASGRGTDLSPLPPIDEPVALLVPRTAIADKTRTLYGKLVPEDLSDGSRSERVRNAVGKHALPDYDDLHNAFSRPLLQLLPEIQDLQRAFHTLGVRHAALSGAGPAHYVIGEDACGLLSSSAMLDEWRGRMDVIWTRTRTAPLRVEPGDDD